jgi:bifunctional non-homologous end joining protein LigD
VSKKLSEYERKRDRKKTPEPFGGKSRGKAPIFVVQRHDARRLHYDFRLERDGVLASWAVPKGVPLEPGEQHLAVHVEDHPLEYASFEGEIPQGNYGAGTVEIWDHGTYELLEEKRDGGLTVRLHGERLDGKWALIPAHLSGEEKNWLILRKREDGAAPAGPRRTYEPMLASLVQDLPSGDGWLFEPKWDGYRALAYVRGGEATLRSRRGNDLSTRFATVAKELPKALRTPDAVVDGEVCALDENGRPSFSAMQQGKPGTALVYEIFDVLEIDGEELCALPLTERRQRLEQLVIPSRTIQVSGAFEDGAALLEAAKEQGLEGVMAKKATSRYQAGSRGRDWLKIKTHGEQEFVVVGYTKGEGRRARTFGSLVLAVNENRSLRWVGNVGTGFTEKTIAGLLAALEPLRIDESPLAVVPKMPKVRKADVVWVRPELVAQVKFAEWTHDGHLRAPVFLGLRDDKEAAEVHEENPQQPAGVKLSNLDKLFWPDDDPNGPITKGDLLDYYRAVAPVLVPHLRGRPFTLRRYPDGAYGKAFFQKDAPKGMPEWIPRFRVEVSTRERPPKRRWIEAPLVNDERTLLWMVNMGCIDMNAWYSRVDKPERPDFALFDLDPSPDVGFKEVVQVALVVKEALDALGLVSFPKTSSAEGMHVLVPIERRSTYAQTREFCEIVAGAIARTHRGLATTEWSKAKRRGVLIDANQNGEGKTIASVYSVRPRPGAPVSTPLRWDEVKESLDPASFTMDAVLERIRRHGDLFEGVLTTRQRLEPALRSLR